MLAPAAAHREDEEAASGEGSGVTIDKVIISSSKVITIILTLLAIV